MTTIGITGSTGHVGNQTALALAGVKGAGDELRLFARDPERAPNVPGANVVVLDYADTHDTLVTALNGVEVLLFVSAREEETRLEQHRALVRAAKDAGVTHVVYTSFIGASPDSGFTLAREHGATEQAIRDAGLEFTFLRDNFYLDLLPFYAGQDGVIRGPAGDGRVAAVARADVSDAACAVLVDAGKHRGRVYDLTGREALTLGEVAARASASLGRQLRYHAETVDEAYESRQKFNAPDWQVEAWVSTYTAIASGELAAVSGDVEALTGHPPRVLEDVIVGPSE